MTQEEALAESLASAWSQAAAGTLLRDSGRLPEADAAFARAVELAGRGDASLHMAHALLGRASVRSPSVMAFELSDRELAVLRLLPGSCSLREIGDALYVSLNTVKTHCRSLYRKLDVGNREAAVARARSLGLL